MNPEFLTIEDVIAIHEQQIASYGGSGGVRDLALLESALGQPRASFGGDFLHEDLFAMAAAYLFHIVKNHPFVDGNKRTGFVSAFTFLAINGIAIPGASSLLYDATMSVADGGMDKERLADLLRRVGTGAA